MILLLYRMREAPNTVNNNNNDSTKHIMRRRRIIRPNHQPLYYHASLPCLFFCFIFWIISLSSLSSCEVISFGTRCRNTSFSKRTHSSFPLSSWFASATQQRNRLTLDILRGGARDDNDDTDENDQSDDEDNDDDDNNSDEDSASVLKSTGESSSSSSSIVQVAQRVLGKVGRFLYSVVHAAFVDDNDQDNTEVDDSTIMTRIFKTINRMFHAAFSSSSSSSDDDLQANEKNQLDEAQEVEEEEVVTDFGRILAQSYQVEAGRYDSNDDDSAKTKYYSPILTGSFMNALKMARSQARLLVVLIPAEKPSRKKLEADVAALQSFLSRDVAVVAESKAIKKTRKQGGGESTTTGDQQFASFFLWSTTAGSAEATMAIKRLKTVQQSSSNNKKVPILLVAYLKPGIAGGGAVVRLVPRLLAQHHCSPPPTPATMAAWLNALRKRHKKQYLEMQTTLQELEYARQRQEGYMSSVTSDQAMLEKERRDKAELQAQQAAAKQHAKFILARRLELRQALLPEPDSTSSSTDNIKTIALRLPNGTSAQRRFLPDTPLATLFNWVDVDFEMEREVVILTTLNGQRSFSWQDTVVNDDDNANSSNKTLADAGLAKMTGLRVTTIQKQKKEAPQKKHEDDDLSKKKTI